ncbi:SDR family oxidoreductase [Sinorhizobium psoraleae]|uniref:SDR family oxidoreductase n=1 Tax=Sinorhizobium psoraleae TaxID=520838 RepID=A0ABT4KMY9_9HYPH|nr:SDR family oxidoreductase [Sinorhizobium psoraleae]MCZ4093150.1 SDR family oxidoreductase [Sinorhizobium psoraleae]
MIRLRHSAFPVASACTVSTRLDDRQFQPDRVIIVTGAVGGIGRALVDTFAANGDIVVAVDLPDSGVIELGRNLGQPHLGLELDVSREDDVVAFRTLLEKQFSQIGVLVNNAGIGPTMAATVDTPVADFQRTLAVNLMGPYSLACETAKLMKPGGAIVNVASLAGLLGNPKRNGYAASKAALVSITKSLACGWASRGIRVTAVAPGYVRTPMIAKLERTGKLDVSAIRRRVPIGRLARPDEIARVVRFLASAQASYITGSTLVVDGGWMSFNQPGGAHPGQGSTPGAELLRPVESTDARTVVVMGGANGIGAAIARRFAANGDTVVIADGDGDAAAKLAGLLGNKHLARRVDRTVEPEVVALFKELRERFGHIDVFVNGPGMNDTLGPDLERASAVLKHILDVNLTGAFTCVREAAVSMRPGSVIVNLGSSCGRLPLATSHAHGAYNAGIDMLTRCMAAEFGPLGIRTATVAPGHIRAPGGIQEETVTGMNPTSLRLEIPLGRAGAPEEVAEAAYFLASSDASYINGSTLHVDGGWTSSKDAGGASEIDGTVSLDSRWRRLMETQRLLFP